MATTPHPIPSQPPAPPPAPPAAVPGPGPVPAAPPEPPPSMERARRLEKERDILARLRVQFPAAVLGERVFRHQLWIDIAPESIRHVLRFLRDDRDLEFRYLVDLTCADYLKLPDYAGARFGVTYILHSFALDVRLRLKAWLGARAPEIASVADLFGSANWAEREVWDLYGVRFTGHPKLTRILMPDDYEGHPLRKDYPLKGRGERDSFPVIGRGEG